jgi:SAM-dependent methyltransferase
VSSAPVDTTVPAVGSAAAPAARDDVGAQTLLRLAEARRLNRWIYGMLRSGVSGDVLEVGSGLGSISRLILEDMFARGAGPERLVLADVDGDYLDAVAASTAAALGDRAAPDRLTLIRWDLEAPPPPELAQRRFDAIVAVNVLEHVADDGAVVRALAALLRPGGRLLVYVPACPFAFGPLDRGLEHRRRYTRRTLTQILSAGGFAVAPPPTYVNRLGLVGWWGVGRVGRRRAIPAPLIALFERCVPLARALDAASRFIPAGLGLVARATKRPA